MSTSDRYTGTHYLAHNPDWHVADSPWKADQIVQMLDGEPLPTSICEVGCGAGEILRQLHDRLPTVERLVGYDIAESAMAMAADRATNRLSFRMCDAAEDSEVFDLMLVMDVIEHVSDPIGFLAALRFKAARTILHIPMDLSAQSVLRPGKLRSLRDGVGHIHYFTPETALATVRDAGYEVRDYAYTRSFDLPPTTVKGRLARLPRRLLPASVTIRVLGGYSILVDAANGTA